MQLDEGLPYLQGKVRIVSYTEANEVLRNPVFVAGQTEEESAPFRHRTLLELNGPEHRHRRQIETPLFVQDALERYETEILEPTIKRCLLDAKRRKAPDGVVRDDLVRLSHAMFVQIAAALIGFDNVDTPERTQLLEDCMYPLNAAFDVKYATRDHSEVIAEGLAAKQQLTDEFYRPALKRRLKLIKDGNGTDARCDLLTVMLAHRAPVWDEDLAVRETILFLAGSTSTTSNAVNHAIMELRKWLQDHPDDEAHLDDPLFLHGVCTEALRLRQNVTALVRRAALDVTLSTGRSFQAGTWVAIDLIAANRDPAAFGDDAEEFNPRRRTASSIRPFGLAFGTGRHQCIGLPIVTSVSGRAPQRGEGDRAMLRIVRALVDAGIELDPERPPTYLGTTEPVFSSLPIILRKLRSSSS